MGATFDGVGIVFDGFNHGVFQQGEVAKTIQINGKFSGCHAIACFIGTILRHDVLDFNGRNQIGLHGCHRGVVHAQLVNVSGDFAKDKLYPVLLHTV